MGPPEVVIVNTPQHEKNATVTEHLRACVVARLNRRWPQYLSNPNLGSKLLVLGASCDWTSHFSCLGYFSCMKAPSHGPNNDRTD